MKKNVKDCKKLSDDCHWLAYETDLMDTGSLHDVQDVFHPTHVAPASETDTWKKKLQFAWKVFRETLDTTQAKNVMREHQTFCDAQALFSALRLHCEQGATSDIIADDLETTWKDFKVTTKWHKPKASFLDAWTSKLSDHEIDSGVIISDSDK